MSEDKKEIDKVIEIMKIKNIKEMNIEETNLIINMMSNLEYFKNLKIELGSKELLIIAKCMKLKFYEKKSQVIHYGEDGNTFYIILKGEVEVLIPDFKHKEDFNQLIRFSKLKCGESFGELAIIRKRPRAATISCLIDCVLLEINYESYVQILNEIETDKMNKFCNYLRNFEIFQSIKKGHLERFFYVAEKKIFNNGQIVYKEDDPIDGIYLIRSGEFSVSKKVINVKNKMKELEKEIVQLKKEEKILLLSLYGRYSPNSDYIMKMKRKIAPNIIENCDKIVSKNPPKYYELIILKNHDMFGDIEIFLGYCEFRTINLKCISNVAEVYFFPKDNFNKILTPFLIENFKKSVKTKSEFYNLRYNQGKRLYENILPVEKNLSPKSKSNRTNIGGFNFNSAIKIKNSITNLNPLNNNHNDRMNTIQSSRNFTTTNLIQLNNYSSVEKTNYSSQTARNESRETKINDSISNSNKNTSKSYLKSEPNENYYSKFSREIKYPKSRNIQIKTLTKDTESYFIEDKIDKSLSYRAKLNVTKKNFPISIKSKPFLNYDYSKLQQLNLSLMNFHKDKFLKFHIKEYQTVESKSSKKLNCIQKLKGNFDSNFKSSSPKKKTVGFKIISSFYNSYPNKISPITTVNENKVFTNKFKNIFLHQRTLI